MGRQVSRRHAGANLINFYLMRETARPLLFSLMITLAAMRVKAALRLMFTIKYVWVTPWFNI